MEEMKRKAWFSLVLLFLGMVAAAAAAVGGEQPLSKIAIHRTTLALHQSARIKALPLLLGLKGEDTNWRLSNASVCMPEIGDDMSQAPFICVAPIKYQYANYSSKSYTKTGKGLLKLQLINQRADFSFALFSGGLSNPKLVAVSNTISFANPKSPVYPRLAQGKSWNEIMISHTLIASFHLNSLFRTKGLFDLAVGIAAGATITS
ncbi:hypothetical protein ACLOJK_039860 [Asimina triloba]